MSRSLKGYTPALARVLGLTPAALYERQRALSRAGLLDLQDGRGPGSGVRNTPASVALLIISALSTDSLSEADSRTAEISRAKWSGSRCPQLKQFETFGDALAAIIIQKALSRRVIEVTVSRTRPQASIKYRVDGKESVYEFVGLGASKSGFRIDATLESDGIRAIADDLISMATDSPI